MFLWSLIFFLNKQIRNSQMIDTITELKKMISEKKHYTFSKFKSGIYIWYILISLQKGNSKKS